VASKSPATKTVMHRVIRKPVAIDHDGESVPLVGTEVKTSHWMNRRLRIGPRLVC
jgi:hypothetical protein